MTQRWDIFCNVVDNYGDIGVAWRLARQLAAEHGVQVRLWVDDPTSLHKLAPAIDPAVPVQACSGVEVCRWDKPFAEAVPAEVVIEAFGCTLPENYVAAMAQASTKPLWVNLEYLSAEEWVNGCHAMASPHPRLPLNKYFFFPGFTPQTGGLLAEHGLLQRRDAFQQDPAAQAKLWQSLGVPEKQPEEVRVSLFGYENQAVAALLETWANAAYPVTCLVPEGRILPEISAFFGGAALAPGSRLDKGSLRVHCLPFTGQDSYDRLLWACDCNFVRGEDSCIRAQWAARPFVWQIYPQQEDAHWKKLFAFLALYSADLAPDAAAAVKAFWGAWNRQAGADETWAAFWRHRAELAAHGRRWAGHLESIGDLASNLVQFVKSRL